MSCPSSPVAALAARAAKRLAAMTRTIWIFDLSGNGGEPIGRETQKGFGWNDAIEALWSDDSVEPVEVWEITFGEAQNLNVTVKAAEALEQRTHAERRTPAHLLPLFDRCGLVGFVEGARSSAPRLARRLEVVL